jgi:cytidine deaminase
MSSDLFNAGWIDAVTAARLQRESGLDQGHFLRSLIERAKELSRPPLSGYRVGAVGLGGSGAIYLGANIEFHASQLNQTIHAEQSVVIHAMAHSEARLAALAISAAPCGSCRQFLNELAEVDKLNIWLERDLPYSLDEFLPASFGPHDLGVKGGLMELASNGLVATQRFGSLYQAQQAALDAANRSYAPYTKAFGGCALILDDNSHWPGSYVENAAFNPSLTPSQTALISLVMAGRDPSHIQHVVVAQTEDSAVDHLSSARMMLASLGRNIVPTTMILIGE